MATVGELLGVEDCFNDMRPRTNTLRCNSQQGEMLEINFEDLIRYVLMMENSYNFLKQFVNNRENAQRELIGYAKIRHNITDAIDFNKTMLHKTPQHQSVKNLIKPKLGIEPNISILYPSTYKNIPQRTTSFICPKSSLGIFGNDKQKEIFLTSRNDSEYNTRNSRYQSQSVALGTIYENKAIIHQTDKRVQILKGLKNPKYYPPVTSRKSQILTIHKFFG